jgi:putative hydrolase of the HAD superfamily
MDWDRWIPQIAVEFETIINPIAPAPGAFDTLASLRKAGLKLGIVSNAQFYTPIMLEAISSMTMQELGFEEALSIWSYREGQAKPEKALYKKLKHQAGKAFQLEPSQILYIGNDVKKDFLPALSVGFKVALYAGDPVSLRHINCLPDEVEGHQPLILTRWESLNQVLKTLV